MLPVITFQSLVWPDGVVAWSIPILWMNADGGALRYAARCGENGYNPSGFPLVVASSAVVRKRFVSVVNVIVFCGIHPILDGLCIGFWRRASCP